MTTYTVKTNMNDEFNAYQSSDPELFMFNVADQRMREAGAPADWHTHGVITVIPNIATREKTIVWSDDANS